VHDCKCHLCLHECVLVKLTAQFQAPKWLP
jgi:hypothetical protein